MLITCIDWDSLLIFFYILSIYAHNISCSTGVNDGSEVVLVGEDRLESMHGDGSLIYNVAWEVTPDSDSTLLLKEDDIPLEKYIDDFRFRMSTSKSGEEDSNGKNIK